MPEWVIQVRALVDAPWFRSIVLTLYYLLILAGLVVLYGKGDFATPSFIYQGF